MPKAWRGVVIVVSALALLLVPSGGSSLSPAAPADADERVPDVFQADAIIDDDVFFDVDALDQTEVVLFLAEQAAPCDAGATCLRDYREDTADREADEYCDGYEGADAEPAAAIIVKVARSCGVNPQVLLVMLQKEQGLVTASAPTEGAYRIAMGYACPDTAQCDSMYYGFANQVYSAARQFGIYEAWPDDFRYRAGETVSVAWSPDASCGAAPVTIANQATANLYNYTPYQPNQAALDAGYGTGDACSSYGNRNFWLYFRDWFG